MVFMFSSTSTEIGETAARLHLSLEMVKYYLFKTRKLLKEGIGMEREFGTKSYQPAKFDFTVIFEGAANMEHQRLFDRKLPGNILVSTYHTAPSSSSSQRMRLFLYRYFL